MKRFVSFILAAVLAACITAFAACGNKANDPEPAETASAVNDPTPEATEEPAALTTEAQTAAPADNGELDPALFERAFQNLVTFAKEPSIQSFKSLYPGDFLANLEKMLVDTLEETGASYQDIGYEDFDDFLEKSFDTEALVNAVTSGSGGKVVDMSCNINSCEKADTAFIIDNYGELLQYIDGNKITEAYKLNVDLNVAYDDGTNDTENIEELFVYVYDGECYLLFG